MRVPLYAKILGWFLLNLLLLAAGLLIFIQVHFGFGLDALISGRAGDQVEIASQLILDDLRGRPPTDWSAALHRYDKAYGVTFFLLGPRGEWLAGGLGEIPAVVRAEIERHPRGEVPAHLPPPGGDVSENRPPPPRPGPPRALLQTADPLRYWAVLRVALPGRAMPDGTLLIESTSLSAGGLFFDPRPWIVAIFAAVAFSALFWLPFVRRMTRAIFQMGEATGRFAEGDFSRRVPVRSGDEIGTLAAAINRMATRLDGFVTGQRRFLGDIAHELCAPLARMQMALGILEERADAAQRARLIDLREEADQMSSLVNELMSFSKAALGASVVAHNKPVKVLSLARRVVQREAAGASNVFVDVPEDLFALADVDLLERALANLLRNAVRYAGKSVPIIVSSSRRGDAVILRVRDEGPGVPPEMVEFLFDPFFRADSARTRETGGVGLGLAIVKTCVESSGGSVSCRNLVPHGFEVTVQLPVG